VLARFSGGRIIWAGPGRMNDQWEVEGHGGITSRGNCISQGKEAGVYIMFVY
jgi:hypothetical protein